MTTDVQTAAAVAETEMDADRISNLWSCEIMAKMTPKTVINRIENISLAKRIAIGFGIFMEYSFLYRYGRTK